MLDEVRDTMRRLHCSIHTGRAVCDWIRRYVHCHGMKDRNDLEDGTRKVKAFLTHLAVDKDVAPSTQNQAMNALVFLYREILEKPLDGVAAARATKEPTVPVVLTRDEVANVIARLSGVPQLIVNLLYGSGLRITEATRLRVHDIDFDMNSVTVRSGKGDKDRITTFPRTLTPLLRSHLEGVRIIHRQDVRAGYGEVHPAHSLARKYPRAGREWGWQYVFPARDVSVDPRSGKTRRPKRRQ